MTNYPFLLLFLSTEGIWGLSYQIEYRRSTQRMCLRLTCPIPTVDEMMSAQDFVKSGVLGSDSEIQFPSWNKYMNMRMMIMRGDTVCIG